MIDVKEAVSAAMQFAEHIYGPGDKLGLTLEEVEPSEDDRYWLITLGIPRQSTNPFGLMVGNQPQRDYKVFKVDADDGKVISMKIRAVAQHDA